MLHETKKRDGRSKEEEGKKNVCVLIQRPKTWQVRGREKNHHIFKQKKYVDYTITETIKENRENSSP